MSNNNNRGKNNKKNTRNKHYHQQTNNSNNNNNSQQNRNRNRNRSNRSNDEQKQHGSILPVPHSRRTRNRQTRLLSQQIQSSIEDSTYRKNKKRDRIDDLKPDAPYNAFNSFFSQCSCDEIFNELTLALKCEENIDIDIHPSGYKIRGRKFINNIMCEFQIEMFYTTNKHQKWPNHILVEFQRRNGDGFVFQQFLHSIFKELRKTDIITFSKFPNTAYCHLSPKPLTATPINNQYQYKQNNNNNDNDINNNNNNNNNIEEKKQSIYQQDMNESNQHWQQRPKRIDRQTLKMLIGALFAGDCAMCRSASSYLASNIANNMDLVDDIVKLEPHIITKFSDLLLKCVDPQIVRSIGCTLYYMLEQSDKLKNEANKLNVKTVCKKVLKRWTEPVETRYGTNNKYVIRVIPSMQVAQRMTACIEVLQ